MSELMRKVIRVSLIVLLVIWTLVFTYLILMEYTFFDAAPFGRVANLTVAGMALHVLALLVWLGLAFAIRATSRRNRD